MAGDSRDSGPWLRGESNGEGSRRPADPGRTAASTRADPSERSDIAEFLSGGVMAGVTVLILGLLGLIFVFSAPDSTDGLTDASVTVEPSEAITATRINGAERDAAADGVTDGAATSGQDIDGDGDVGADEPAARDRREGGEVAAGADVDGDGDTAGDGESRVDPAAGDDAAGDDETAQPGPDTAPAADATDPSDAVTPSDAPSDAAQTEAATEGGSRRADGGATADGSAPPAALPGPGERSSEQRTVEPSPPAPSPPVQDRPAPTVSEPADTAAEMPDRDGGPGLFSADDPGRQVATVPDARPRDVRVIHADLDGDGEKERIWAAVVADRVLTRIERVVDGAWTPVSEHTGAVADRLVALRARDLTGDGRPEVHTRQWVGTEGESITLWSYADDSLRRMSVTGGCADGSNTIGLVGALVRRPGSDLPGLVAVCRDPGLPPQQWPSGLYEWGDGTWTFLRYQGEMP
jgi:hypothetical protein